MRRPRDQLEAILAELRATDDYEAEEEIGRGQLAGLLLLHWRDVLDDVLRLARRDHRVHSCLAAARYYSGLNAEVCERIDEVLRYPFPGAVPRGKRR